MNKAWIVVKEFTKEVLYHGDSKIEAEQWALDQNSPSVRSMLIYDLVSCVKRTLMPAKVEGIK